VAQGDVLIRFDPTPFLDDQRKYEYQLNEAKAAFSEVSGPVFGGVIAPPTGLTATGGLKQVVLSWTAPASGADSYAVYRDGSKIVEATTGTTYTDAVVLIDGDRIEAVGDDVDVLCRAERRDDRRDCLPPHVGDRALQIVLNPRQGRQKDREDIISFCWRLAGNSKLLPHHVLNLAQEFGIACVAKPLREAGDSGWVHLQALGKSEGVDESGLVVLLSQEVGDLLLVSSESGVVLSDLLRKHEKPLSAFGGSSSWCSWGGILTTLSEPCKQSRRLPAAFDGRCLAA
jgi:hypothetical protein